MEKGDLLRLAVLEDDEVVAAKVRNEVVFVVQYTRVQDNFLDVLFEYKDTFTLARRSFILLLLSLNWRSIRG
jgi:hypothetical protein